MEGYPVTWKLRNHTGLRGKVFQWKGVLRHTGPGTSQVWDGIVSKWKTILRHRSPETFMRGSLLSRVVATPRGGNPQLRWGAEEPQHCSFSLLLPFLASWLLLKGETNHAVNLIKEIYWWVRVWKDESKDGCPLLLGVDNRELDKEQGLYWISWGRSFSGQRFLDWGLVGF